MRDGHDDDDGDFGIPSAIVTVIADVCKIGGSALRVTAVTVMTAILGYPAAAIPAGEHPVNAKCRRGHYSPFSARKATPAVRKIPRFFRLRLQKCSKVRCFCSFCEWGFMCLPPSCPVRAGAILPLYSLLR